MVKQHDFDDLFAKAYQKMEERERALDRQSDRLGWAFVLGWVGFFVGMGIHPLLPPLSLIASMVYMIGDMAFEKGSK